MTGATLDALGERRIVVEIAHAIVQQIADIAGKARGGRPPVVALMGNVESDERIIGFKLARELAELRGNLAVARARGDENPVSLRRETSDDPIEVPQIHEIAEDEPKALFTQFDRPWLAVT